MSDEFASMGDEFAIMGDAFAIMGDAFAIMGDEFAIMGDEFAIMGDEFAIMGDAFASMGDEFAIMGDAFASMGDEFAIMGDAFASMGDEFARVSDAFASMGDEFARMGDARTLCPCEARREPLPWAGMSTQRDLTTLGYRRIVQLLVYLMVVPGVLLSAVGVLLLVLKRGSYDLLMGILVLTFTGTLVTGVILVWVFLRRERDLSELQADFVSKVSHELRTPLTSIRMFTETLALRRDDPVTEERCIDALKKESSRLQMLIDRLLDWGRMESGRRIYELAQHEVASIVDEAINAFEPTRERRAVELQVDIEPNMPHVLCDKSALVDSLVNLLSNAYKYGGDPRFIEVQARLTQHDFAITVRDNGKGIARNEHKRIFEKFYRVDDLLARKQEGSGLGLSIVQHVMRAHGGRVVVDSAPGKGSAFTLMLKRFPPSRLLEAVKPKRPVVEHGGLA